MEITLLQKSSFFHNFLLVHERIRIRTSKNGSGAEYGRSKHLWILGIRVRNTDTKEDYIQCRLLYVLVVPKS
jgi:hypothetical protein